MVGRKIGQQRGSHGSLPGSKKTSPRMMRMRKIEKAERGGPEPSCSSHFLIGGPPDMNTSCSILGMARVRTVISDVAWSFYFSFRVSGGSYTVNEMLKLNERHI
eukprot:scaffold21388_cov59-Cylindrotheca_fusiformis.AAC.1